MWTRRETLCSRANRAAWQRFFNIAGKIFWGPQTRRAREWWRNRGKHRSVMNRQMAGRSTNAALCMTEDQVAFQKAVKRLKYTTVPGKSVRVDDHALVVKRICGKQSEERCIGKRGVRRFKWCNTHGLCRSVAIRQLLTTCVPVNNKRSTDV